MKKRVLFILLFILVFSIVSFASESKFSEYDFSKWIEVRTTFEDFQDIDFGGETKLYLEETDTDKIPEGWIYTHKSGGKTEIRNENGNICIFPWALSSLHTENPITSPYVLSYKTRLSANKKAGYFVRASADLIDNAHFYEGDGSDTEGLTVLGSSGIMFRPSTTTLTLYVKKYDSTQTKNVGNEVFVFNNVPTFQHTAGSYQDVAIIDDGTSVSIYVADEFIVKVTFSDIKKYDISDDEFYSKAIVTDKDGNVLGNVENALICTESTLAFGTQEVIVLDDIKIVEYKEPPTTEPTSEPETTNPQTSDSYTLFMLIFATALLVVIIKRQTIINNR